MGLIPVFPYTEVHDDVLPYMGTQVYSASRRHLYVYISLSLSFCTDIGAVICGFERVVTGTGPRVVEGSAFCRLVGTRCVFFLSLCTNVLGL